MAFWASDKQTPVAKSLHMSILRYVILHCLLWVLPLYRIYVRHLQIFVIQTIQHVWKYWAQEIGIVYQTYWAIKFYFQVIKKGTGSRHWRCVKQDWLPYLDELFFYWKLRLVEAWPGHIHPLHRASENVVSQPGIEPGTSCTAGEYSMKRAIRTAVFSSHSGSHLCCYSCTPSSAGGSWLNVIRLGVEYTWRSDRMSLREICASRRGHHYVEAWPEPYTSFA